MPPDDCGGSRYVCLAMGDTIFLSKGGAARDPRSGSSVRDANL
jgi:hypothetical protein